MLKWAYPSLRVNAGRKLFSKGANTEIVQSFMRDIFIRDTAFFMDSMKYDFMLH